MSINRAMLLGRLGQDPELKYTPSGAAVCNFSLATSESWTDKSGERKEQIEWHRVVVWNKLAELCNQYLSKGRQAFVEGSIQTRSWDDTKTGEKKYATEIKASSVQFIGSNPNNAPENKPHPQQQSPSRNEYSVDANFSNEQIPF